MRPLYVHGLGLWTRGYPGLTSWCAQQTDPSAEKPAAELLQGPLRRRAPPLTRMSVEVLQQATAQAGCDPSGVRSVWATAHGEHTPAIKLLEMMKRGEGKLSPTHFHNSVHNTASGYASIATENRAPSTTLTGGSELVVAGLLEAVCLLQASEQDVVLVLADEPLVAPFERAEATAPLALAVYLATREKGAIAVLSGLRRDLIAPLKPHDHFGPLYVSAALPLVERIATEHPGTVALQLEGGQANPASATASPDLVWCVDVELVPQG